jgi:site-specific recombinase XerD
MNQQGLELSELINKVKLGLENAKYSDLCINGFVPIWNHLTDYLTRNGETIYTAKIGINFLEAEYGITVYKKLTERNRRCARAINLLTDYVLHGMIFSRIRQEKRTYHPQFQVIFQGYIDSKRTEGIAEDTLKSHELYLGRLSDYLNSQGIRDLRDVDEKVVSRFTETFVRYSSAVIHCTLCSLRTFFHYLYQNSLVSKDFAYVIPHDGYRQRTKVPSAYPKEEVEKLLVSIDRGNPKGKRDYAIILMAARLGLRAQDICNLCFNNLKWETNTIEILQEKTKEPLVLPLLEDVGLAIIDYLKYARPEYEFSNAIFLRLVPPVGKLEAPTLHSIVTQRMHAAGIKIEDGKKHGPHSLRHSLASALLEANTPLPVISEVLGHTNTASTSVYLKIDINQLRTCALESPSFYWNQGEEAAF